MKDYSEQHKKPGSMMRTTSGSDMKEHWKEEQKKTLRILQKESHDCLRPGRASAGFRLVNLYEDTNN